MTDAGRPVSSPTPGLDLGPDAETKSGPVVLRPGNVSFPYRGAGREVRLLFGARGVELRRADGRTEALTGPGEVAEVRWVGGIPAELGRRLGLESWLVQAIEFLDGAGHPLLLLAPREWTPDVVFRAADEPASSYAEIAGLHGAPDLAHALGARLTVFGERPTSGDVPKRVVRPGDDVVQFGDRVPVALYVAGAVAFGLMFPTRGTHAGDALAVVAASLAVAVFGLRCGQYLLLLAREQAWRVGGVVAALRPRPARRVNRRFRWRAKVQFTGGGELVIRQPDGSRRWLGGPDERFGAALADVVTYQPGTDSAPAAALAPQPAQPLRWVDFRDSSGRLLARFWWEEWFAGEGGEAALLTFCAAAGISVDPSVTSTRVPDEQYTLTGTAANTPSSPSSYLFPINFTAVFPALTAGGLLAGLASGGAVSATEGLAKIVLGVLTAAAFVVGFLGTGLRLLPRAFLSRPRSPSPGQQR